MTGSRVDHGPHIDDGDLIRLFDGECSSEEAEQIRSHIEKCPECRDNSDTLEHASERLSGLLAELEYSVPQALVRDADAGKTPVHPAAPRLPFFSSRYLRAAAVLAAMVLVFAATPARAWLVQGWEALKSLVIVEASEPAVETEVPEIAIPEASSVITFTPRGSTFRLEFTERPAGGTLLLLFDSATTASAGVIGGDGADEMILLPNGLRVRNSASSFTSYEVRLPLTLSVVHVLIAGAAELRLEVQSLSAPFRRELELSGDQGR